MSHAAYRAVERQKGLTNKVRKTEASPLCVRVSKSQQGQRAAEMASVSLAAALPEQSCGFAALLPRILACSK